MRKIMFITVVIAVASAFAERQGPWTKEKAWEWYNAQPWIRGCNYMPASAANRFDMWQSYGSEARFAEMDAELAVAHDIGFNAVRVLLEENGFAAYHYERERFLDNFERFLGLCKKHGLRAIVGLGNDCSRPKELWSLPKPGPQTCDWGYHGGRKQSQHGSFPNAIGYTSVDDPELRKEFFKMCEEILTKYRADERILFWNVWNEPGNNGRGKITVPILKALFELAWKIDPVQPLAADVWGGKADMPLDTAQGVSAAYSDIVSYHSYAALGEQIRFADELANRYGRPMVNTEWLARIFDCNVQDVYPFFAQRRIGCTMWGLVAGKYQTYEPWESMWRSIDAGKGRGLKMTRWFHDLLRPSLRPYDPEEIDIIRRVNAEMDAEREGQSLRAKIAKSHKVMGEDMWYDCRRTKFDFNGHEAWVVEPSVKPAAGMPWTWTMQCAEAYVDRTGVPDLLKRGFHHATISLFETRMTEEGVALAAAFQKFLVDELGLAPKAGLVGLSWGGFFSVRYAAAHPENVAKICFDGPLMNFDGFGMDIGPWAKRKPADGVWTNDPEMPVNMAGRIAVAKIPVLLLYGGQDQTVPPKCNCELFASRFRKAGGEITVNKRGAFGHHPHGLDPDKTQPIVDFFTK